MPEANGVAVHIGCNIFAPTEWNNFDNSPTILLSRLPIVKRYVLPWPKNVRRRDVVKQGLPFGDGSVDFIYSSHTFEHFSYPSALRVAKECRRVLRPGGILRLAVPDLRRLVADYLADASPLASQRFIERLMLRATWRELLHPGATHQQMFDNRSLLELLRQAGFPAPEIRPFGDSGIPGILRVELRERQAETVYAEAVRA